MDDFQHALVLAGINAIVVAGCIMVWATILGAIQW